MKRKGSIKKQEHEALKDGWKMKKPFLHLFSSLIFSRFIDPLHLIPPYKEFLPLLDPLLFNNRNLTHYRRAGSEDTEKVSSVF
jgi:hypothetical protein